jgi:hypothetical protein
VRDICFLFFVQKGYTIYALFYYSYSHSSFLYIVHSIRVDEIMESNHSEISETMTAEAPIAVIKKRSPRPNQRRREEDDSNNQEKDEREDDGIDREKLKDLKLLRELRQAQTGVAVEDLIRGDKKSSRPNQTADDLKSMLGNQFNSRMDYGMQQEVPHQKLMEEFIEEKLGLKKDTM